MKIEELKENNLYRMTIYDGDALNEDFIFLFRGVFESKGELNYMVDDIEDFVGEMYTKLILNYCVYSSYSKHIDCITHFGNKETAPEYFL